MKRPRCDSRGHFFAAATEAMRRILIENARHKRSQKGGGGLKRRDLDEVELTVVGEAGDLFALDDAREITGGEAP